MRSSGNALLVMVLLQVNGRRLLLKWNTKYDKITKKSKWIFFCAPIWNPVFPTITILWRSNRKRCKSSQNNPTFYNETNQMGRVENTGRKDWTYFWVLIGSYFLVFALDKCILFIREGQINLPWYGASIFWWSTLAWPIFSDFSQGTRVKTT